MNAADAMEFLDRAAREGEEVVEVLVVESEHPDVSPGCRLLVWEERIAGGTGVADVDRRAREVARGYLAAAGSGRERIDLPDGTLHLHLTVHRPPDDLVILGAGHIARPLCVFAALLGYRVTVLDDRPEFATTERFPEAERVLRVADDDPFAEVAVGPRSAVLLATRGHRLDFEALRKLLARDVPPAYIGMVGSRRRVRATLEQLVREGFAAGLLERIHAPVGLDIGAETPEEIAVAIVAELVCLRRGGGGGGHLSEREAVAKRLLRREG